MKKLLYQQIHQEVLAMKWNGDCVNTLQAMYPYVRRNTLYNITSQSYQRHMKNSYAKHHSVESLDRYYKTFQACVKEKKSAGFLIECADKLHMSPASLARLVLEQHVVTSDIEKPRSKSQISRMMKNPAAIDHPVLAREVQLCIVEDEYFGPLVDAARRSIGFEYEFKLKQLLEKNDIAFITEDKMRADGYDKTPDFKLEVPIAVDGRVVNWMESKASFGDEENHSAYLKDQYWSYWNRFGSGLVIYWFDFIEELDVNRDKGILLMNDFPAKFETLDTL